MQLNSNLPQKTKVFKLMEGKRWVEALNLLDDCDATDHFHYKHIAQCAKLESELKEYIAEASVLLRLKDVLCNSSFGNLEDTLILDIEPVLNGHVCIYAIKITCVINTHKLYIFEKIFPAHRAHSARNETNIYQSGLLSGVNVPRYYGTHHTNNFSSNYYEWVNAKKTSLGGHLKKFKEKLFNPFNYYLSKHHDQVELSYQVLDALWSNKVDLEIVGAAYDQLNKVTKKLESSNFLNDGKLDQYLYQCAENINVRSISVVTQFIKKRRFEIDRALLNMPIILMHQDINKNNMLVNEHLDVFLIDWDKFYFSRVGDAFFRFYRSKPLRLFKQVLKGMAKKHNLELYDLLLAIIVYQVAWAISKNKHKSFKELEHLIEYFLLKSNVD